jgi:hypothetical protein
MPESSIPLNVQKSRGDLVIELFFFQDSDEAPPFAYVGYLTILKFIQKQCPEVQTKHGCYFSFYTVSPEKAPTSLPRYPTTDLTLGKPSFPTS